MMLATLFLLRRSALYSMDEGFIYLYDANVKIYLCVNCQHCSLYCKKYAFGTCMDCQIADGCTVANIGVLSWFVSILWCDLFSGSLVWFNLLLI